MDVTWHPWPSLDITAALWLQTTASTFWAQLHHLLLLAKPPVTRCVFKTLPNSIHVSAQNHSVKYALCVLLSVRSCQVGSLSLCVFNTGSTVCETRPPCAVKLICYCPVFPVNKWPLTQWCKNNNSPSINGALTGMHVVTVSFTPVFTSLSN